MIEKRMLAKQQNPIHLAVQDNKLQVESMEYWEAFLATIDILQLPQYNQLLRIHQVMYSLHSKAIGTRVQALMEEALNLLPWML
jgi:hypothetical protein